MPASLGKPIRPACPATRTTRTSPLPVLLAQAVSLLLFLPATLAEPQPEKLWAAPDQLPVNLLEVFDNDGISSPPHLKDGNFDCPDHPETVPGSTYPGEHVPDTGSVFRVAGKPEIHFLFPSKEPGEWNNVACNGQFLDVLDGAYQTAYLLGASENGNYSGTFEFVYLEGPGEASAGLSDWCQKPSHGETTAIEIPYRYGWVMNATDVGREDITCRLWIQKVALDPRKNLRGLVLPFQRRMHLFAVTLHATQTSRELVEEAEDTARLYVSLKTRKAVFANELRAALAPLRQQMNESSRGNALEREFQWLRTSLDYIDWRLPEGDGRVPKSIVNLAQKTINEVKQDSQQLVAGTNPFPKKRGQFLKSYYSPLDDSWQTYALSVPGDYRGDQPYPLMVRLHGHGWYDPFQGYPPTIDNGVIVVTPQGRGSIDYMLAAEEDVLRVIEEVQKDHRIDPDRIILEGHSMGGTGSWNLGVKFPDRFACLAPVCGNSDHTVWTPNDPEGDPPAPPFHDVMKFVRDSTDPITYAANLGNVPVFCAHGAQDTIVRVEHSRHMIQRLTDLGFSPLYREFDQVQHWGFPGSMYNERWTWMLRQKRDPKPQEVRFKTARLRYPGAYWLRVHQFAQWGKFAEIRAQQPDPKTVRVLQADNVASFSIRTGELPKPPQAPLTVWVGDEKAYSGNPEAEIRISRIDGQWRPGPLPEGLWKSKNLEGPVGDALLSPFLIVYGTISTDPLWNRMTRDEAEQLADDWKLLYRVAPRIRADRDVTPEDMARFNLILYGGPEHNSVAALTCPRLPVRLRPGSIRVQDREFTDTDVGLRMIFPNPLQPDRCVVLSAALSPLGLWQINNRFGNWIGWGPYDNWNWFDYAVFDGRTWNPETMRCVGFFGPDWGFDPKTQWMGIGERRSARPPRALPRWTQVSAIDPLPERLSLPDLLPSRIRQHKGTVNLNRSFRGNPLRIGANPYEKGFGVRAPSTIEFRVGGKFQKFRTEYGIDLEGATEVLGERSKAEWIQFRVLGDGKRLWSSEWIQWNTKTQPVEVDVRNVDLLRLEVDGGGRRWLFGSAAWGNPELLR